MRNFRGKGKMFPRVLSSLAAVGLRSAIENREKKLKRKCGGILKGKKASLSYLSSIYSEQYGTSVLMPRFSLSFTADIDPIFRPANIPARRS